MTTEKLTSRTIAIAIFSLLLSPFVTNTLQMPLFAQSTEATKRSPVVSLSVSPKVSLMIESTPDLQLRKLSTIYITVKSADDSKPATEVIPVKFDAEMPDHNHGMMVKPTAPKLINQGKEVVYQVEGVKLHMPGDWVIKVTVKEDGKEKELSTSYFVKI
jgi:hypothetical protein